MAIVFFLLIFFISYHFRISKCYFIRVFMFFNRDVRLYDVLSACDTSEVLFDNVFFTFVIHPVVFLEFSTLAVFELSFCTCFRGVILHRILKVRKPREHEQHSHPWQGFSSYLCKNRMCWRHIHGKMKPKTTQIPQRPQTRFSPSYLTIAIDVTTKCDAR